MSAAAAAFQPGRYGHRGEIVDGWETKRRREPGHEWALVRLGAPSAVTSADVDTSFFTGNFPPACAIEASGAEVTRALPNFLTRKPNGRTCCGGHRCGATRTTSSR